MQKMQQEIQEFYQRENFSPYSGCLPLLVQLPIIMALYSIIINPLHYVLGQGAGISTALETFATTARAAGGAGLSLGGNGGTIAILSSIKQNALDINGIADFAFFSNGGEVWNALNSIITKNEQAKAELKKARLEAEKEANAAIAKKVADKKAAEALAKAEAEAAAAAENAEETTEPAAEA